jgi:hypothetical protein
MNNYELNGEARLESIETNFTVVPEYRNDPSLFYQEHSWNLRNLTLSSGIGPDVNPVDNLITGQINLGT